MAVRVEGLGRALAEGRLEGMGRPLTRGRVEEGRKDPGVSSLDL